MAECASFGQKRSFSVKKVQKSHFCTIYALFERAISRKIDYDIVKEYAGLSECDMKYIFEEVSP